MKVQQLEKYNMSVLREESCKNMKIDRSSEDLMALLEKFNLNEQHELWRDFYQYYRIVLDDPYSCFDDTGLKEYMFDTVEDFIEFLKDNAIISLIEADNDELINFQMEYMHKKYPRVYKEEMK